MKTIHHFYPWGDALKGYSGSAFVLRHLINKQILNKNRIIIHSPSESAKVPNLEIYNMQITNFQNLESQPSINSNSRIIIGHLYDLRNNIYVRSTINEIVKASQEIYFHYPFWLDETVDTENSVVIHDIIAKLFSKQFLSIGNIANFEEKSLRLYQRHIFLNENDVSYYDLPNSHIQNFDSQKLNLDLNINKFLLNKFQINKTKKKFLFIGSNYIGNRNLLRLLFQYYDSIKEYLNCDIKIYVAGSIKIDYELCKIYDISLIDLSEFELNYAKTLFDYFVVPPVLDTGLSIKRLVAQRSQTPIIELTSETFSFYNFFTVDSEPAKQSRSDYMTSNPFFNDVGKTLCDLSFIETLQNDHTSYELEKNIVRHLSFYTPFCDAFNIDEIRSLTLNKYIYASINETFVTKLKKANKADRRSILFLMLNFYSFFYNSNNQTFIKLTDNLNFDFLSQRLGRLAQYRVNALLKSGVHDEKTITLLKHCVYSLRGPIKWNLFNLGVLNVKNLNYFGYNYLLFLLVLFPLGKISKDIREILVATNFSLKILTKCNLRFLFRMLHFSNKS